MDSKSEIADFGSRAEYQLGGQIIRSTGVKRPNIVVRGENLSKVEVWAVPTGTGITPDECTLLGTAIRRNAAGQNEVWVFPIPLGPLSATDIFAKGFDADGKLVGTKSLPYQGATQIYDALWGDRPSESPPRNRN